MPVACLDLGGPKDIVTPQSGIIVNTGDLNSAQVAARLADQLYEVLSSPASLARLSAGAVARASEFLLSDRVSKVYAPFMTECEGSLRLSASQLEFEILDRRQRPYLRQDHFSASRPARRCWNIHCRIQKMRLIFGVIITVEYYSSELCRFMSSRLSATLRRRPMLQRG